MDISPSFCVTLCLWRLYFPNQDLTSVAIFRIYLVALNLFMSDPAVGIRRHQQAGDGGSGEGTEQQLLGVRGQPRVRTDSQVYTHHTQCGHAGSLCQVCAFPRYCLHLLYSIMLSNYTLTICNVGTWAAYVKCVPFQGIVYTYYTVLCSVIITYLLYSMWAHRQLMSSVCLSRVLSTLIFKYNYSINLHSLYVIWTQGQPTSSVCHSLMICLDALIFRIFPILRKFSLTATF